MLGLADEKRGADQLVDDALELLFASRSEKPVERAELADLAEGASQLGLKDDDERDEGDGEEGLQQEGRQGEVQVRRDEVNEHQDHDTDEQLNRSRSADEEEHVVNENRDDEDVENIVPAERLPPCEDVQEIADPPLEGFHQSASARASTSAARSLRPSSSSACASSWHFAFATSRLPSVRTTSTSRRCAS